MTAHLGKAITARLNGRPVRQLARESGVSESTIRSIITTGKATNDRLTAIAAGLDCSVGELLGEATNRVLDGAKGLRDIRVEQLRSSPLNPRPSFDDEQLAQLADSIAAVGLLENLVVRVNPDEPGSYWVVAGERRSRAIQKLIDDGRWAGDTAVPCKLVEADDAEHVALAITENDQREGVPPMAEARAFQFLKDSEWSTARIADKCGRTTRHVQLRLRLVRDLVPEAVEALEAGKITMAHARAMVTYGTPDEQRQVTGQLLDPDPWEPVLTADQIREDLLEEKPAAGAAIFALEQYKGKLLDTGEGADDRRFLDVDQFWRLQMEAVAAKVEELEADGTEWVRVSGRDEHCSLNGYEKTGFPLRGAVINVNDAGAVHVFTGLVKAGQANAAGGRGPSGRRGRGSKGMADGGTALAATDTRNSDPGRLDFELLEDAWANALAQMEPDNPVRRVTGLLELATGGPFEGEMVAYCAAAVPPKARTYVDRVFGAYHWPAGKVRPWQWVSRQAPAGPVDRWPGAGVGWIERAPAGSWQAVPEPDWPGAVPAVIYPIWEGARVLELIAVIFGGEWYWRTGLVPILGALSTPIQPRKDKTPVRIFRRPVDWIAAGGDGCLELGVQPAGWCILDDASPEALDLYRLIGAGGVRVRAESRAHFTEIDKRARPPRAAYRDSILVPKGGKDE